VTPCSFSRRPSALSTHSRDELEVTLLCSAKQTFFFHACRKKINQLNAEIDKLKASMSPVGSSTALSPSGEVQLSTAFNSPHLTTSDDVDPAVTQEKIKELRHRISEVSAICFNFSEL